MTHELLNCEDGKTHYSVTNPNCPDIVQGRVLAKAIRQYKPTDGIRRTNEVPT